MQANKKITRHICPRNCFSSCGLLGVTSGEKLIKISGDPKHGYTKGKLCPKGFNYLNIVYHPERLKYPLRRKKNRNEWTRISWGEAIDIIAKKILELEERYGSHESLALNKYSGNFGVLHSAAEGFFNSLGKTTRTIGSPCWSAGLDAHYYDFGNYQTSDLRDLEHSKLIIMWGVNPTWTSIHALQYINSAKGKGALTMTIDPIYTETAKKSDYYIQVNPGSDGALALALAKVIIENGWESSDFIENYTIGWEAFKSYLSKVDLQYFCEQCGQAPETIKRLARLLVERSPLFIWTGFGLQRHANGGQNIRAINALAALTGNIGKKGSGSHFAQQITNKFPFAIMDYYAPGISPENNIRPVDINNFATEINNLKDPPVNFLWVSCRNLLSQTAERDSLIKVLKALEFIVVVDLFLTPTAKYADIILPTTTFFEEWDIVSSYWHHWIGINEPAIAPYYESKTELEIAQLLSKRLNELKQGSCHFPVEGTALDFIEEEFTEEIYKLLNISHWKQLLDGPRRANIPRTAWRNLKFTTPSGKFEFYSERAAQNNLPAIANYVEIVNKFENNYPYWLLTTHCQYSLNSQFLNIYSFKKINPEPIVYIHPSLASEKNIEHGSLVKIYNQFGETILKAHYSKDVAKHVLLYLDHNIVVNNLIPFHPTDMGKVCTGSNGIAFYDVFVNIEKV